MNIAGNEGRAADFVRRFEEFWRAPSPERLDTVLAERVRLVAPPVNRDRAVRAQRSTST